MTRGGPVAVAALICAVTLGCASDPTSTHDHTSGMDMGGMDMGGSSDGGSTDETSGDELTRRLADAEPGETIVVEPGTYQGSFVVRRPVHLVGEGLPVLDGGGEGTVLRVAPGARGSTVRGLHVMGTGPGPVGTPTAIRVEADDVIVEDNLIMDSYMGIQVIEADDATVADNTIVGFEEGAVTGELHATGGDADMTGMDHGGTVSNQSARRGDAITLNNAAGAVVEGNDIDSARDGVFLTFARDATVRDNEVRNGRYAVHAMYASALDAEDNFFDGNLAGAILMYGGPFELTGNTVMHSRSPATGFGFVVKDGAGVVFDRNVIAANRVGIKLDNGGATSSDAEPALIRDNTIGLNQIGVEVMVASHGAFSGNSFVENTVHVVAEDEVPEIEWTVAERGNYWSSYKGYDNGGDGVGDLPYVQGGSIEHTLTRSPSLIALMSGPAFRLLQAVEDRWAPEDPVALDTHPMMEIASPTLAHERRSETTGARQGIVGVVLITACALLLLRARIPRHRSG